jgi:hypothetical protein
VNIDESDSFCCNKKHLSSFNNSVKNKILNYCQSMKSKEQQNEYLKSVVIPKMLIQKIGTIAPRTSNFEYFAQFCDENNQNLIVRKKICKTAFLMLHRIKESRLRK